MLDSPPPFDPLFLSRTPFAAERAADNIGWESHGLLKHANCGTTNIRSGIVDHVAEEARVYHFEATTTCEDRPTATWTQSFGVPIHKNVRFCTVSCGWILILAVRGPLLCVTGVLIQNPDFAAAGRCDFATPSMTILGPRSLKTFAVWVMVMVIGSGPG